MKEHGFFWAVLIGLLLLARVSLATDDMSVVGQAMGNSDAILIHVGLAEPNNVASWGLGVSHRPETGVAEQSTAFGLWGALSTDIQLVQPGTLGLWAGLAAKPFIGIDVLFDVDNDKIFTWPGAGVRIAPTKTMAFMLEAIYPVGKSGNTSPLPTDILYGLEVKF